ncbi:hypothetical protein Bca101_043989 [Brassica carinata]
MCHAQNTRISDMVHPGETQKRHPAVFARDERGIRVSPLLPSPDQQWRLSMSGDANRHEESLSQSFFFFFYLWFSHPRRYECLDSSALSNILTP